MPVAEMPLDAEAIEIIHAGPAEGAVGDGEARRLDDVDRDAEAGRHAQHGAGILWNVRLIERKAKLGVDRLLS